MVVATPVVLTVNVPVVAPAAIVMLAGTVAAALLLASVTAAPPVGAGAASVIVPVEVLPPSTLVGFSVTDNCACVVAPFTVATGSVAAYCRTRTLLNSATVPFSPYSAMPPLDEELLVAVMYCTPSLNTSSSVPCTFTDSLYQVLALTVPTAAVPSVAVAVADELFTQLYTYRLLVVPRSSIQNRVGARGVNRDKPSGMNSVVVHQRHPHGGALEWRHSGDENLPGQKWKIRSLAAVS